MLTGKKQHAYPALELSATAAPLHLASATTISNLSTVSKFSQRSLFTVYQARVGKRPQSATVAPLNLTRSTTISNLLTVNTFGSTSLIPSLTVTTFEV